MDASLTQVFAALILPPASLLLVIAAGLWFGRRYSAALWVAGGALFVLGVLSLPLTARLMAAPFEAAFPPLEIAAVRLDPDTRYVVVVLGGGRDLGALEYPEKERLSSSSLQRARYGVAISRVLGLPLALTGGTPGGGTYSEAELMRKFIVEELKHAVDLVEGHSRTTYENALHVKEALHAHSITNILLVTDVTHMPRAVKVFTAAGMTVIPVATHYSASAPWGVSDLIPSSPALDRSVRIARELFGMLWYGMLGRTIWPPHS